MHQHPFPSAVKAENSRRRPHGSMVTPTPKKLRTDEMSPPDTLGTSATPFSSSSSAASRPSRPDSEPGSASSKQSQEEPQYSRKKKSLGVLAETFCRAFSHRPPFTLIVIDELAARLGVERRRIYDVVNIFEAIQLVQKKGKNTYCWIGFGHLPQMFALLQNEAMWGLEHGIDDAVASGLWTDRPSKEQIIEKKLNLPHKDCKSLSRLSQHFLQVFLVGNTDVSLPEASDKIHGQATNTPEALAALSCQNNQDTSNTDPVSLQDVQHDPKKLQKAAARGLKTKIRRLYDIANVFLSVGILSKVDEKVMVSEPQGQKRPRYRWAYSNSPRDLMQVYAAMPEHMKQTRTPFVVADENKHKSMKTPSPSAGTSTNVSEFTLPPPGFEAVSAAAVTSPTDGAGSTASTTTSTSPKTATSFSDTMGATATNCFANNNESATAETATTVSNQSKPFTGKYELGSRHDFDEGEMEELPQMGPRRVSLPLSEASVVSKEREGSGDFSVPSVGADDAAMTTEVAHATSQY